MATLRVRARTVDMLGRQQIAGIPTAIHELLKNAHDAYAERVDLDLFRKDHLLIIRDNGFGMTRSDFEGRWLTLGTESKIGTNTPAQDFLFPDRKAEPAPRSLMGEKGIGRLAISMIGSQTLVMTRATRKDGLRPLVVCLVPWQLFEVPGLDLDRIELPVEELPMGVVPDSTLLRRMTDQVRSNLERLGPLVPENCSRQILSDLEYMKLDPSQIDKALGGLTLSGDGYGTHFYIRPINPLLIDDIEGGTDERASRFQKTLLGFSNTMMDTGVPPTIVAEFRDHREDGTINELMSGNAFFTPREFQSADHHIEGNFDEYGHFSGTVSLYDLPAAQYSAGWSGANGQKTDCGPFRIKFGYVHRDWKDSRLPQEEWAELTAKLNRIAGLYVYRDGIRILPYGNSDYDFLNIEVRRTLKASDWFFSYRGIMGAIAISGRENAGLVEKAGREGFRENKAYRQFVGILENLFKRLGYDFFRPSTQQFGDAFYEVQKQINRERELLKKREGATRAKRKQFISRLDSFFGELERGTQAAEADRIRTSVQARLAEIGKSENPETAAKALLELEEEVRNEIDRLVEANTISRPRSVGLTRSGKADWVAYTRNAEKVRQEILAPLAADVDALITKAVSRHAIGLKRQQRLTAAIESKRNKERNLVLQSKREVDAGVRALVAASEEAARSCMAVLAASMEKVHIEVQSTDIAALPEGAFRELQSAWEARLEGAAALAQQTLDSLKGQLETVTKGIRDNEMPDETTAAIESVAEGYREQLDLYIELAQVGMALGIVQHEFVSAVVKIRKAIGALKPWADGTPELRGIHNDLKVEFDHLDAYLKLFTPLSRRLNRQSIELSGEEIRRYLLDVFRDRFKRHAIKLAATKAFDSMCVHGFPSTFLPAFVNILDNAVYWIASDRTSERTIRLDSHDGAFEISNGGPGIERRLAEQIFEYGMTTKPGGRGLGLYISREVLRRGGYDLTLETGGASSPPTFRIAPLEGLANPQLDR